MLTPGNGNQLANRNKARKFVAGMLPDLKVLDDRTIEVGLFGICHFKAFTSKEGAMISSTRSINFGSLKWHTSRRYVMLFRDCGDGDCIVYICPVKPLFAHRTIGYHGVPWKDVEELAEFKRILYYP